MKVLIWEWLETLVAGSYCELYSLSRTSLAELVSEWPHMERVFRSLGER